VAEPPGRWRLVVQRQAAKDLAQLPREVIDRVATAIDRLTSDARPTGCAKVVGIPNAYRLRVRDYRIVYEVDDADKTIYVVRVRHRREVYRRR
jgi:mRNA interferase RelE/StbE